MTSDVPIEHNGSAADETTALIAARDNIQPGSRTEDEPPNDADDRPLPKDQIFWLCFAALMGPIAYFCIFPYINQMIEDTGNINEKDVGFYSGLIESLFSFTQMLVMILWSRAANRFGRKPVLVISMAGVAITVTLFGFGRTLWEMIVLRCLQGVFAGTIVTIRTMISEISTPKTQARAFSFFAFSGNMGILFGPLIGGALADPAQEYPGVFGNIQLFKDFPYALPTIVTGSLGVIATISSAIFIKETLVKKDAGSSAGKPPMTTWEIVKSPGVGTVLFIYSNVMLLAVAYTSIVPVFWHVSPENGGLGLRAVLIAAGMSVNGAAQAFWLLIIFPPLQHRIGTGGVLRICAYAYPLFFLFAPFCNFMLRQGWDQAFWICFFPVLAISCGVSMAFTGVQLALNDISPSPEALSVLNGVALSLVSGIRAVVPYLFGSLFATSARTQILGGYLIWLVMIICAVVYPISMRWLPAKAEGKIKDDSTAHEA